MDNFKKQLPSSIENEESLLGAIMIDNKAFVSCDKITTEMFYEPRNALIFEAAIELKKEGSSADIVTISDKLSQKGMLESAGGSHYIAKLSLIVPTATHAKTYAKSVFEAFKRREAIMLAENAIKEASDTTVPFDIKSDSFEDSEEIVGGVNSDMMSISKGDIISFGFKEIDRATGGVFPTSLTVIAGDTGDGKSEFAGNIVLNASAAGKKVAFFNLENDKGTTVLRFVSGEMSRILKKKVLPQEIMTNDFMKKEDMKNAYEFSINEIKKRMKNVYTFNNETVPTVDDFEKYLNQIEGVDLVVIDHLHYFSFISTESEHTQIGRLMRTFRNITKRKKIPIVLVSHLRKRPKKEEDPTPTDLHGSSDIAKEATAIILLNRIKNDLGEDEYTKIILAKNRIGEVTAKWGAEFDRNKRRFVINMKIEGQNERY